MKNFVWRAGVALVTITLLAAAARLQAVREREYPPTFDDEDTVEVSSGAGLRRLTGAFNGLAADVYWIRAIQYYGGAKSRLASSIAPDPPPSIALDEYRQLYPMLNITTSLDPRFSIAYRFGSVFLAEAFPAGAGRPDLAIKLLEKGLREQPDKWEYMEDVGFIHYWYRHDFRAAAQWFDRAAHTAGAPWWLASMAATTLAEGGDRRSSRLMWEAIRQTAENDWLRNNAEHRLLQLRALDQVDDLQNAVDAFAHRTGGPPRDWAVLARANGWTGLPLDPVGAAYELSPDGRVRLSRKSSLWPLPEEPDKTIQRPPS